MPPKTAKVAGEKDKVSHKQSNNTADVAEEADTWNRTLLPPEDQLDLTEAELAEEVQKTLTCTNTNVSRNLVVYNFRRGGFIPLPLPENTVTLFSMKGTALHRESEEAVAQMLAMGSDMELPPFEEEAAAAAPTKVDDAEETAATPPADGEEQAGEGEGAADAPQADAAEGGEGAADEDEGAVATVAPATGGKKKAKLINQFNYCERAALTFTNPSRSVDTQTIPPPRSSYGANILQWVIYDWYADDFEQQQKEKEKEKKAAAPKKEIKAKSNKNVAMEQLNKRYLQCWQILERIINQNIFDDVAQDYRYYEDPSDDFREEEGTLLPLWRFFYEKTKRLSVTDICFNTNYYDLFAVCFGSLDFMKQGPEGCVCLYTLKNPSFPDYRLMTESGVMCCDIHPNYCFLLVIGMYDGNIAVYNLQVSQTDPIFDSNGVPDKHTDLVSEVKWGPDMADGEINFFSVSVDGRILNWVLAQSKLIITPIITLQVGKRPSTSPDGIELKLRACGSCMVFHPTDPEVFMVGTERGDIFKCSKLYSSKYLMHYNAHFLPVYRIDYNKFNANIFASCSGDWRVKVWEDMRSDPLFVFDLGSSVGDVKWAPYSTTVLAAVTSEGKVYVFDVNVNRYKAICIQQVVTRKTVRLTRISFNQKLPFIVVGDDKGIVTALKLSPNLRLKVKPPKKQQNLDQLFLQNEKLEKLLSLVRELPD